MLKISGRMAQEITDYFYLEDILLKLNMMADIDKKYYLKMLISTLIHNTIKRNEALNILSEIESELINYYGGKNGNMQ